MPWRWFAIYPVLQLEYGGRSCISGMLWDSRSGAAGDEMGVSSPPSRWCILWVAHTPPCPVCGTKDLSGQVVVEQKRCAHSSDFLQPSWILMCLLRSVGGIASVPMIFLSPDKLKIAVGWPHPRDPNTWGRKDCSHTRLESGCLSPWPWKQMW